MNNKYLGNSFEHEFCKLLAKDGFWAYNTPTTHNGQPVDVIAQKNGITYLIDCKTCHTPRFELSRMEENQKTSMDRFYNVGGKLGWFAVLYKDDVYMLYYGLLRKELNQGTKSVEVTKFGRLYKTWLKEIEK